MSANSRVMRSLFWVLLVLVGCKPAHKESDRPANLILGLKLERFGRDGSKENLEAALNALRTSNLFIAVKPNPNGGGGQAAIRVEPKQGQVLYAFLEEPPAATWWGPVEGLVIQQTAAPRILELAAFEQADELIIDPQLPDRSLVIPRDNYAPITKAWANAGSGTLH